MGTTDGTYLQCGGLGVRFEEITDGLSNTLLVGEKHVPLKYFREGPLDSSAYNGDYFLSHARSAGPDSEAPAAGPGGADTASAVGSR